MRVLLQLRKFSGGPYVFRGRLNKALSKVDGIDVVNSIKDKFDVELSFIRNLGNHSKPKIIRVDGCYYRPGQNRANKELRQAIRSSKHVIFQSEFSRRMVCKMLSVNPQYTVIPNGIDTAHVDRIPADNTVDPGSFVAAAGWRPNKRPNSMIRGFLEANTGKKLYVVGNPDGIDKKLRNAKGVVIVGNVSEDRTVSIMKSCSYLLHLCHIDSCPNAVVEGLSCGLNVLCTNLGGTKELVGKDGVVLRIDKWDFKPNAFKNVDKVNPRIIASGIEDLMKIETKPNRPDLDIHSVAKVYANTIKEKA